jgi:histone H3/H4
LNWLYPSQEFAHDLLAGILKRDSKTNRRENSMSEQAKLVVMSKLKSYIKNTAGFNTSSAVGDVLSKKLEALADQAIEKAKKDKRKTVMDRDFA